jgi:hypothetical protein
MWRDYPHPQLFLQNAFFEIDSCCCDEACELVEMLVKRKHACISRLRFPVDFLASLRKSHPGLLSGALS